MRKRDCHYARVFSTNFIILTIEIKSLKAFPAKIKWLYEGWLMEKAKSTFKHKVDEYSKKLGVKVEGIAIKDLKIGGAV